MDNLFASPDMAAGYASFRPAVHPQVLQLALPHLPTRDLRSGLDVGCGSGVSTKALQALAPSTVGLEPAVSMLRMARQNGLISSPVAGRAEQLPFRAGSFDLITAAGSLNYTEDTAQFFREAARLLTRSGTIAVYDFSPGRAIPGNPALRRWFDREFMVRYPRAADNAKPLDPQLLAAESASSPLSMTWSSTFQIPLALTLDFYVNYLMTETNVAYAIRNGALEPAIRQWCRTSLTPIFGAPRQAEVFFEGYLALFRVTGRPC